jgi:hypothetical protein
MQIGKGFRGSISGKQVRGAFGKMGTVAVLVTMDDPSETLTQYGDYTLTVKGPFVVGNRQGR